MRPRVDIQLSTGGLNIPAPNQDGTCAVLIASPVAPVAGYGVPFLVKTAEQAKTAFAQVGNEDVLKAFTDGFFAEAPAGTKLYVMCMAQTTTLTTLAAAANAEKVLIMGGGEIRIISFIKFPAGTYVPVLTTGFDGDVHTAVTAAQALADTWFAKKQPFSFFVEGFAFSTPADAKDYGATKNRNGHIVVGAVGGSTAVATMLAVGRAARSRAEQNIGRIKSGSLNIAENVAVTIGATAADKMADVDLDTLYDKRYITFNKNLTASGFVFDDDNALVNITDDFNNLRYNRVIANATRLAFSVYYRELKEDVDVDEGGRLSIVVEKALENAIEVEIDQNIRTQLSKKPDGTAAVECLVNPSPTDFAALYENAGITNPNFNILQTGIVYIFLRLRPKGCLKYINVFIGYTA